MWWIFVICSLAFTGIALLLNCVQANQELHTPDYLDQAPPSGLSDEDKAAYEASMQDERNRVAAARTAAGVGEVSPTNIYTSGPVLRPAAGDADRRDPADHERVLPPDGDRDLPGHPEAGPAVIVAKLVTSALLGVLFWVITSVLNLIFAPLVLSQVGLGAQLGEGAVWRAIALNGLAYVIWAVLGVGFGVLIRSQLAATITLTLVYVVGTFGASIIFQLLTSQVAEWFSKLQVIVPTTASALMISGTELPGNPPRWVGAAVLIAYALVTGVLGTLIMRRRDIS